MRIFKSNEKIEIQTFKTKKIKYNHAVYPAGSNNSLWQKDYMIFLQISMHLGGNID